MRQTVGLVRAGRQQTKVVKGGREALCFDPDSMSSIKRDVNKKVLPRPEARCFLEIQPTGIWLPWRSLTCAHSDESPLGELAVPSSGRERQANGDSRSTMVLCEARGL